MCRLRRVLCEVWRIEQAILARTTLAIPVPLRLPD